MLNFLINFAKTVYDIWKKESESKERVMATPEFTLYGTNKAVGVELYNAGNSSVAIKRVALVVKTTAGEIPEFMPSADAADSLENDYFIEASALPESVSRLKIDPKKDARFYLDRHTERTVDWLLKQPSDEFWIVVESFMGEIARVSGKDIQAVILNTPYGKAIRAVEQRQEEMRSVNSSFAST